MSTVKLADGGSLAYEDAGRGPALLFIHGWAMHGGLFRDQQAALCGEFRVLSPDLRGHGGSTPTLAGQGIGTLSDDLSQLLDALRLEQAVVVGWSMGAMVAWSSPLCERLSGLVVVDMVPRILNDEHWHFGLRAGRDASVFADSIARMLADWPAYTRRFVPRIFARGSQARRRVLIERICADAAGNEPASMARLWTSMVEQDFRDTVRRLQVPALVIHGELSQLYEPQASRWLADTLPDARLLGFARSGHAPHLEEPRRFSEAVADFARTYGSDSPGA